MSLASRRKCDNADGSLKSRFLYADARMPVAVEADGQTYYLACDQVGSLRAVADANGTVVKAVTYDSFGNVLEDSNENLTVLFGFAGGLYDADAGLVRFGFRDYDAEAGRWTAKDPIGFKGGDGDLYGYCSGEPVNWVDIDGKFPRNFFLPDHWYMDREIRIWDSAFRNLPKYVISGTVEVFNNCSHCTVTCTVEVGVPAAAMNMAIGEISNIGVKTIVYMDLERAMSLYGNVSLATTVGFIAWFSYMCTSG